MCAPVPNAVTISPATHGTWEQLDDVWSLWRIKVKAPEAEHVNLGFQTFFMPAGARMQVYSTDYRDIVRPFDANDDVRYGRGYYNAWTNVYNETHGAAATSQIDSIIHLYFGSGAASCDGVRTGAPRRAANGLECSNLSIIASWFAAGVITVDHEVATPSARSVPLPG